MGARIAIYGFGGFGREVLPIALAGGGDVVFVADAPAEHGLYGRHPVMPLKWLPKDVPVCVAVANWRSRRKIVGRCRSRPFTSLVAQTHYRGQGVVVGEGAIFCERSIVTADALIGRHFHCNILSYVAHDCVIGDFVTLAPRVSVNGNTVIEDDVYIGTGAVLKNGAPGAPLVIGKGAVIGMGAVVTRNVPAGATVVGNPARLLGVNVPEGLPGPRRSPGDADGSDLSRRTRV